MAERDQIERALLTSILVSVTNLEAAFDAGVEAKSFRDVLHRRAFEVIEATYGETLSVCGLDYLRERGVRLRPIESTDSTVILARRLRDRNIRDDLEAMAAQVVRGVHDPVDALKGAIEAIAKIQEVVDTEGAVEETQAQWAERFAEEQSLLEATGVVPGIPWAWDPLTVELLPLARGLYVVYGRKKSYKTTFCLYNALRAAQRGHRVVVGSGELFPDELRTSLLAMHARVSITRLLKRQLWPEERERLSLALPTFKDLPIYIPPDRVMKGRRALDAFARRARSFGSELTVLDGCHRLADNRNWEEVADYSDHVLDHANGSGAPWIAVCQANRSKKWALHDKADITDSDIDMGGNISWVQHARLCLRMNKANDLGRAYVHVTDNRYGPAGQTFHFHFDIGIQMLLTTAPVQGEMEGVE
jgi:replicative DNA helicase